MTLFARQWPWLFSVVLIGGGCASFNVGDESDGRTIGYRSDGKSANEPASLANDPMTMDRDDAGEGSATVHVSDALEVVTPASKTPIEYRSAAVSAPSRPANLGGTATAAAPPAEEDYAAAFDQLMLEARRRGTLSAAEEAAFRNDLAKMPAHLRPQMAAMLLAMRGRQMEPATATGVTSSVAALRSLDASGGVSSIGPSNGTALTSADLTTADRLARIASQDAGDDSLADNPLRALAASSVRSASRPANASRAAASNAPAELATAATQASSLTAWPDSATTASGDRAAGDRGFRSGLQREAVAARHGPPDGPGEEWQVMLGATIRSLEAELASAAEGDDKVRREALLRLLYLVADRLDDAARPVPADKSEQQFWIDWLYGTSVYLDRRATPHDGQRAAVAADRLREAVNRLGEQANLAVSNLAFCRRVTSFGVYEPFASKGPKPAAGQSPQYEFAANQEVLLYAEVRNFASVPTEKGYHTQLRPSYQIFDIQGRRLGSVVELDESHDYCQRPRTDFFVCYHIYLPTRIDPGAYKLKLTIEDVHGHKVHENSVDFSIKAP
ncbi:MAG: hypothetical protein WD875_08885 [Pirellulales bacterium]